MLVKVRLQKVLRTSSRSILDYFLFPFKKILLCLTEQRQISPDQDICKKYGTEKELTIKHLLAFC